MIYADRREGRVFLFFEYNVYNVCSHNNNNNNNDNDNDDNKL